MLTAGRLGMGNQGLFGIISSNCRLMSSSASYTNFEHLSVSEPSKYVFNVELNRPKKMNAMNQKLWGEIGEAFRALGQDAACRAIILSGSGKIFTSGIDLSDLANIASITTSELDAARKATKIMQMLPWLQEQFTCLEKCPKPVIAAIHSACVGGGIDLITAADVRLCTQDAWFQVKEVDIGLAADVGTLQRLPKVIGSQSLVSELCFTARKVYSDEAVNCGLVSRVFDTKEKMMASAIDLAASIAAKSPVAVQGTKVNLVYARDHTVQQGLDHVGQWNSVMLQTDDIMKAVMAAMDKSAPPPEFDDL